MNWAEFRKLITQRFDSEEIRTLCFDLEIDFDSLRGEGKEAKVREMVAYFRRIGRLPELVAALSAKRSDVPWEEILARRRRVIPALSAERKPWLIGAVALLLLVAGILLGVLIRSTGLSSSPERVAKGEYKVTYPRTMAAGTSGIVSLAIGRPLEVASIDVAVLESDVFGPAISRLAESELVQPVVRRIGSDSGTMDISENMRAELDGFREGKSDPIARVVDIETSGRPAKWQWNVVAPDALGLHTFTIRVYRGSNPNPWEKSYEYQVVEYAADFVKTTAAGPVQDDASSESSVLAELPAGTTVQPVGRDDSGNWLKVSYGEDYARFGWVPAANTDFREIQSLPVVSSASPTETPTPTPVVIVTPLPTTPSPTSTPTPPTPTPTRTPTLTPSPTSEPALTPSATVPPLPQTGAGAVPAFATWSVALALIGLVLLFLGAIVRRSNRRQFISRFD